MDGQIEEEVSKNRITQLISIQNAENRLKSKEYIGKTIEILCEGFDAKKGAYLGRDEFGRMAYFNANENKIGEFVTVKIIKAGGISLIGEII